MQTAQLDVADSAISGSCGLPVTALTSFVHPSHSAHMLACCVPVPACHHFCLHPSRHESLISMTYCAFAVLQTTLKRCRGTCHGFIHFNTLTELQCAVSALKDIAQAMRQAAKNADSVAVIL